MNSFCVWVCVLGGKKGAGVDKATNKAMMTPTKMKITI